ncbi:GNAT family N-acetyltransferase [Pseudonocardia sp.]|uniref:GNAT family N-acetyltransferase n=1 Tax=Pseudonocardia sp. TaxID=60912 RepID=UPI002636AE97|nr:GNAT family N-acetyltransferase [Pseudonocardia sp.]
MQYTAVRPAELGAAELRRWTELRAAARGPRNPFLSAEFARAVGAVRPAARVTVLEDGGRIVGFFAHERHGRVARPVGAGLADAEGLVLEPGAEVDVAALLGRSGLAGWDFDCLVDGQVPPGAYRTRRELSPVIDLAGGYDPYLAAVKERSKKWLASTFRKQRKLEREVGELRFEPHSDDPAVLRTLMGWKSAQYAQLGEWDRFADPRIVGLAEDVSGSGAAECTGFCSALHAGEHLVAAHLGPASGSVLSWWFPGYDVAFGRYSPGILLLFHLAQEAARRGIVQLDLGRGRHDYKDAMMTGELVVHTGSLDAASVGSLPRRARRIVRAGLRPLVRGTGPIGRTLRAVR